MAHNKAAVQQILDKAKADGRTSLTAPEGKLVCDAYGITVPKEGVATTAAEAAKLAAGIYGPMPDDLQPIVVELRTGLQKPVSPAKRLAQPAHTHVMHGQGVQDRQVSRVLLQRLCEAPCVFENLIDFRLAPTALRHDGRSQCGSQRKLDAVTCFGWPQP